MVRVNYQELLCINRVQAIRLIETARARYEKLAELKIDRIQPMDGSRLAMLNEATDKVFVLLMQSLFSSAKEGLKSGFAVLDQRYNPRSSAFVLLRSSIEASSYIGWLLSIRSKDKQQFEAIKLIARTLEDMRGIKGKVMHFPAASDELKYNDYMSYLENQASALFPTRDLGKQVSYSTVVNNCDRAYEKTGKERHAESALVAWRICSAVTHSNFALRHLSNAKGIGKQGQAYGNAELMNASQMNLLCAVFVPAVENLDFSVKLYKKSSECQNVRKDRGSHW